MNPGLMKFCFEQQKLNAGEFVCTCLASYFIYKTQLKFNKDLMLNGASPLKFNLGKNVCQ